MYGAIFGDIIGSRFEFDRGGKTKDFELFTDEDSFTDDTVMTVAVAEALLESSPVPDPEEVRARVTASMRKWGRRYPDAGYGGRFYHWLFSGREPEPYGSYGNGSAMRVSAAGWLYGSIGLTKEVARATAEVTHNHPEGIKGAECTAAVIFMARTGSSKDEIRKYVEAEFGYKIRTLDELRPLHEHVESCQDSLPKALASFLEGESYEDVVRNAVSLGGDTDTIAAIAGSMAEAFHGITVSVMTEGQKYIPEDMKKIVDAFERAIGRGPEDDYYADNVIISDAVAGFREKPYMERLAEVFAAIIKRADEDGQVPTPMVDANNVLGAFDPDKMTVGTNMTLDSDVRLRIDLMQDGEGKKWVPLFTEPAEIYKGQTANIQLNLPIKNILISGCQDDVEGIVINPFGESLTLTKMAIGKILDECKGEE